MKNITTFREFLTESKKLRIFHGDNHSTTRLDPKLMNNGNNQEGIGIYFSTLEKTAHDYGKDVVYLDIDPKKFIPSRDSVRKHLKSPDLVKLLKMMHESDMEAFYYFVSDFIEVYEPEDVNDSHIREMTKHISSDEIRNFQIDMARNCGVNVFVNAWNTIFKNIHGTYNTNRDDEVWYCVINDKLKLNNL